MSAATSVPVARAAPPARRSARACSGSTACPRSPAATSSAPTPFRPMRCGSASCARRMRSARFALGRPGAAAPPSRPGRADGRRRARSTASASIPTSRTSRCWPMAQVRYRGEAVVALVGDRATVLGDPRRGGADRLDARAARASASTPRPPPDAPLVQADKPDNLLLRWRRAARRCRRGLRSLRRRGRGRVRDGLRRARLYRARGGLGRAGRRPHRSPCHHPDALHGPRRGRERDAAQARGRCASCRPPAAAASAASSIFRCSRWSALAAWKLGRPVPASTRGRRAWRPRTKRHPARVRRQVRLRCRGQAAGLRCDGDVRHRRLCLLGPDRRQPRAGPCHGSLRVPNVRTWGEAFFTNCPPAGAFRGFGVPQAAIAHEAMMDELADKLGIDRLEFRHRNALRAGDTTATGQTLDALRGPRRNASTRCGRTGRGAATKSPPSTRKSGIEASRRRHRLHVVRHRQHRRCPTPRACGSAWRRTAR